MCQSQSTFYLVLVCFIVCQGTPYQAHTCPYIGTVWQVQQNPPFQLIITSFCELIQNCCYMYLHILPYQPTNYQEVYCKQTAAANAKGKHFDMRLKLYYVHSRRESASLLFLSFVFLIKDQLCMLCPLDGHTYETPSKNPAPLLL